MSNEQIETKAEAKPKAPKPINKRQRCSEEFFEAIRKHSGTAAVRIEQIHDGIVQCGYCKRKYVTWAWVNDYGKSDDNEDGDSPDLEEHGVAQILDHGEDHTIMIDGREWVAGCDCNGLRQFEDWLVFNIDWVLDFYGRRSVSLQQQARQAVAQLRAAAGIHSKPRPIGTPSADSRSFDIDEPDDDGTGIPF